MPWWFGAIAALIAAGVGYGSFHAWRKARLIEDVPTSKIRSAAQGYVELEGIACTDPDIPLKGPLTGSACVWYDYRIEEYVHQGKNRSWKTIEHRRSHHAIIIEDNTGRCFIHPDRAAISTRHKQIWRGSSRRPDQMRAIKTWSMGRYRYTEQRLQEGDPVYALGFFETLRPPTADELTEQKAKQLLAEWKQDYDAMVRRFDRDGNGDIDTAEWEHIRTTARREAYVAAAAAYDTTPVHVMVYPPSRSQPFIIANKDPKHLARSYRWQAAVMLAIAAGASGFLLYNARI